jgi:hypothetical protein
VKKPKWPRWRRGEKSSFTKSENLKSVRRQTDQRLKQQVVQKEQRDEAEKKKLSLRPGAFAEVMVRLH